VWDRVDDGAAHGITSTYLSVLASATPETRAGSVCTVVAEALDGDALRARLVG
jgi:hypothetical protein